MKTKLKDSKIFRWIVIPVCIAMCLFGRFIPGVNGFSSDAFGVLFIFIGTLILWLTIGIDWPSIVCICALAFIPSLATYNDAGKLITPAITNVLKSSFGDQTFIFLLFTFICTYALSKTSLIRRIAISFVNFKWAKKSGYAFIFLFLLSVLLLGLFMSPSVLFVVILPILNEVLEVAGIDQKDKIAKVMLLGLGFTVSISSGMTPIAHVFPVYAIQAFNEYALSNGLNEITQIQFLVIAMPCGIILFALMFGLLILFIRPEVNKLKDADVSGLKNELPKVDKKDIATLVVFVIVLLLWIIPEILKGINDPLKKFIGQYGNAIPPLIGAIALFIIHVDKKPILTISDAFKNGVPWPSLIMCAGALAIGSALTNKTIGIQDFLKTNMQPFLSALSPILILIIFGCWAALQTNVSSNMVTAKLVSSVAVLVLGGSAIAVNLPALICVIGMLASFAFATPPSMPHIAIVAGSESCSTKDCLIYGGTLMILSVVITLLVGYPLGMLIFM